jgi:hypothetical protein
MKLLQINKSNKKYSNLSSEISTLLSNSQTECHNLLQMTSKLFLNEVSTCLAFSTRPAKLNNEYNPFKEKCLKFLFDSFVKNISNSWSTFSSKTVDA